MTQQRIAIVYDWIDSWGGVERVLLTLHEMFPHAEFFTSYIDREKAPWAKNLNVHPSFIQQLPSFIRKNRALSFPLYPYAFESFDFRGYDLVISVTSAFAKGIITRPETPHICYLLTPTRYLWLYPEYYLSSTFFKWIAAPMLENMRRWDYIAAQRPDRIITLSQAVADRCRTFYHREASVIYPPFDQEYWSSLQPQKPTMRPDFSSSFFLLVSRLEPYKMVETVVKAFSMKPDQRLIIVGKGRRYADLQKLAGENTLFLHDISDQKLAWLYQHANALIMPQEEDFGYVALEAQFFNCPVVAYGVGGVRETVMEGKTGIFFSSQSEEAILQALERVHTISYNGKDLLQRFAKKQFQQAFIKEVELLVKNRKFIY